VGRIRIGGPELPRLTEDRQGVATRAAIAGISWLEKEAYANRGVLYAIFRFSRCPPVRLEGGPGRVGRSSVIKSIGDRRQPQLEEER